MRNVRLWLGTMILVGLVLSSSSGAGRASGAMLEVDTDTSWLVTKAPSTLPTGWNTDPGFDTSSWSAALIRRNRNLGGVTVQSIWAAQGVNPVLMRKTFTLTSLMAVGTLYSDIDDDADVYLNGHLIISDHNGVMQFNPPLDVTSYLVVGVNLMAVDIVDNQGGLDGDFGARLVMNSVPEPPTWLLVGISGPMGYWWLRRPSGRTLTVSSR